CGLLLFPFRNWSPRRLLFAAFFLLVLSTYRENSDLYENKEIIKKGQAIAMLDTTKQKLTDTQKEALGKFTSFKSENDTSGIAKEAMDHIKDVKGSSYLSIFRHYKEVNMKLQSVFFYNSWWDVLMLFFVGMALYKSGFLLGKKSPYVYLIVGITGTAIGLVLNYFNLRAQYHLRFDTYKFVQEWTFSYYDIRRVCQTMGYLSLLIVLYKISPVRKLLHVFAPVGQMAFTNYLSQSIITSVIFYGFGLFDTMQRYQIYYVVAAIWLFQIIFSYAWMKYFLFGPFEWVWRALTYRSRPPMRRKE
ncbi:MAG: DUF418 domain-containing protein, partial [Chitinophagaceae bacterium]